MDALDQIEELGLRLGVDIHKPMTRHHTRRLIAAGMHEGIPIYQLRQFLDWNENIQVVTRRRTLQAK